MNLIQSRYKIAGALESLQGGRPENQDFMGFADTPIGFAMVLCDGMGGGPGGRTASTTVVDAVIDYLCAANKEDDVKTTINHAISNADKKIAALSAKNPVLMGMGTTIVVLLLNEKSAHVAHVGDSRLYQFRFGHKAFRTSDHSQVGEMVRNGDMTEEQARVAPNSNVITRAINGRSIAKPDIIELPYESGDRFVLCTDGIWGSMPEPELIKGMTKTKSVSGTVVQMAFDVDEIGKSLGGTHDNLSIAVIDTKTDSKLKVRMGRQIRNLLLALVAVLAISMITNVWTISSLCSAPKVDMAAVDTLNEKINALCNDTITLKKQLLEASAKPTGSKNNNVEIEAYQKEIDRLQVNNKELIQKNEALQNELSKLKSNPKPGPGKIDKNPQPTAKQKNVKSAITRLNDWISELDKQRSIKEESIEGLIDLWLKNYSSDPNVKNAINNLRSAKQSKKTNNIKEQKKLFTDAKKLLEKVK